MLPSFRLIAVTFLCGFVVVFAGLRLAASLNDIHEALPVMAAHAAPVSITPVADREARRGLSAVPVMYDLRFAVSTVAPTLVRVPPTVFDRPAAPAVIVPPEALDREASSEAEAVQPESAVAAIQPETPATVSDAPSEPPAPKASAIAAVDSQAKPDNAASGWPAAGAEAPAATSATIERPAAPPPGTEESLTTSEAGNTPR
jgi:hypothetical protein